MITRAFESKVPFGRATGGRLEAVARTVFIGVICALLAWLMVAGILILAEPAGIEAWVVVTTLLLALLGGALGGVMVSATARMRRWSLGRGLGSALSVLPFYGLFALFLLVEDQTDTGMLVALVVGPSIIVGLAAVGGPAEPPPQVAISSRRVANFQLARVVAGVLVVETVVTIAWRLLLPGPYSGLTYGMTTFIPVFLPAMSLALSLCFGYAWGVWRQSWQIHRSEWGYLMCVVGAVGLKVLLEDIARLAGVPAW